MGRQDHDNAWLAKKLSVSEMWVSRRLRCITEFSADDVVRVAQALEVPVTQFLPVSTFLRENSPTSAATGAL